MVEHVQGCYQQGDLIVIIPGFTITNFQYSRAEGDELIIGQERLMERLRDRFDPHRTLAPGRFGF